ncbi:hypothetical protein LQZ18_14035 [Lachnospiraceae bacterium ZAX-1]
MNRYRVSVLLLLFSYLIFANNLIQMHFLKMKELVNMFAVWESSSFLGLIVLYILQFGLLFVGKNAVGLRFGKWEGFCFYSNPLLRLVSSLLANIYIKNTADGIWAYLIQVVLIIIAGFIDVKFVFKLKVAGNVEAITSSLKLTYDDKPIPCLQSQCDTVARCVTASALLAIVNADYLCFYFVSIKLLIFLCLGNIAILSALYKYLQNRMPQYLNENFKAKYILRTFICQIALSIILLVICRFVERVEYQTGGIIVCWGLMLTYTVYKLVVPICNILNGMELYLKLK